jgi:hypothetical protein
MLKFKKMIKKFRRMVNAIPSRFGYEIRKTQAERSENQNFTLYKYLKRDGSFDYDRYRKIQIERNKRSLNKVFVIEENIAFLSEYIRSVIGVPRFGICHGTRQGREQEWFRKYLACEVIGTEISETAEQFPYTIQWDFHKTKDEWINATDFIYSNAFDHSYDPQKCLDAWMSCLRVGGLCILEHSSSHEARNTSDTDPFGSDLVQMPYLILTWGKGKYGIREIMNAPVKYDRLGYLSYIVLHRF